MPAHQLAATALAALTAAGLGIGVGASPAAEPAAEQGQAAGAVELTQRIRNPDRIRYYRIEIEHEGTVRFRTLTQLAPGLLQNTLIDRKGGYTAKSAGPVAVESGCVTFEKFRPLPTAEWPVSCRAAERTTKRAIAISRAQIEAANKRAIAAIRPVPLAERIRQIRRAFRPLRRQGMPLRVELAIAERINQEVIRRSIKPARAVFPNQLRRYLRKDGGEETYRFGPTLLNGELAGGENTTMTWPITTRVPGVPNLVFCTPQQRDSNRMQTSPQTGLVVRLISGDGVKGSGTDSGLRIKPRSVSGAPPAGFREDRNQVECPTADPARPRVDQAKATTQGTDVWQPVDLLISRDRRLAQRRASKLEFTKPAGTFGKPFTVEVKSLESERAIPGRGPVRALDEHMYTVRFMPCPNAGKKRAGC